MVRLLLKIILFPVSLIYGLIMLCRNWFYDLGILSSRSFPIPIISVGNIRVGGTGKTPMILYLIQLLSPKYKLAVLSRGYGRRTTGFRKVEVSDDADLVGDEMLMLKKECPAVHMAVCEDRVRGVEKLLELYPDTSLILLDDAFQHRRIKPYLHLVLSAVQQPYYTDMPLPSGRLREFPMAYRRADAMIFTKLRPDFSDQIPERIWKRKRSFKTSLRYNYPEATTVYGFSGLANNKVFKEALDAKYDLKGFRGFPDHYKYTELDLVDLRSAAGEGVPLMCSSKDKVKLLDFDALEDVLTVGIKVSWEKEEEFQDWLNTKLSAFEG